MDKWVQELCAAQGEARKLILATLKVGSRTVRSQCTIGQECGKLVTRSCYRLTARARAGQRSSQRSGWVPTPSFEIYSPQVVVLKEPNSRNRFTVNVKWIKLFNAATPTILNSSSNTVHYEVEEVLEECTMDTGKCEFKVKWVGYTNCHNSWVTEEDLHANCRLEQYQASKSSATMDRVQSTKENAQLSHPTFQLEMNCAFWLINISYFFPSLWVAHPHVQVLFALSALNRAKPHSSTRRTPT